MKLYYLRGALGDTDLLNQHEATIKKLLTGDYHSSDLEKLQGHEVYSFRLSAAKRLLFAVETIQGQRCMVVLDYLPTHDYHKSRFLHSGVLSRYRSQHSSEFDALVTESFKPEGDFSLFENNYTQDSSLDVHRVDYYQKQWIVFNAEQDSVARAFPALCAGVAGSGKTCVALSLIISYIKEHCPQREDDLAGSSVAGDAIETPVIRYVTQSLQLREMIQAEFAVMKPLIANYAFEMEFKTFNELVMDEGYCEGSQFVGQAAFSRWLTEKRKENKSRAKAKGKNTPLSELLSLNDDQLYEECRIASAYNECEYSGLGKHQTSLLDKALKQALYALYQQYIDVLAHAKQIDSAFYQLQSNRLVDFTLVDEAQDFSYLQARVLSLQTKENRIVYFMDSHQRLYDRRSIRPFLLSFIPPENHIELQLSYRSPLKVIALANTMIHFKRLLAGGASDKHESSRLNPATDEKSSGFLRLCNVDSITEEAWLMQQLDKTSCAVITREELLNEARARFPTPLIFTPKTIKGLEFDIVITYKLYQPKLIQALNACAPPEGALRASSHRPKAGAEDYRWTTPFNEIYTAYTRTKQILVICEALQHQNPLFTQIARLANTEPLSDGALCSALEEDWHAMAVRQIALDNRELARLIIETKLQQTEEAFLAQLEALREHREPVSESPSPVSIEAPTQKNVSAPVAFFEKEKRRTIIKSPKQKSLVTQKNNQAPVPQVLANGNANHQPPRLPGDEAPEILINSLTQNFTENRLSFMLERFSNIIYSPLFQTFIQKNRGYRALLVVCALRRPTNTLFEAVRTAFNLTSRDISDSLNWYCDEIENGLPVSFLLFRTSEECEKFLKIPYYMKILKLIKEDTLNAIVKTGPYAGKSLAYLLSENTYGLKILRANNDRLAHLIHEETLNTVIQVSPDAGKSVAYWLAVERDGLEILRANNSRLRSLIQEETLNTLIQLGPDAGKSVAYWLAVDSDGLNELFFLYHLINKKTLNAVISEGPDAGKSIAYLLARDDSDGPEMLQNLKDLIDNETLNTVIEAGPDAGKSLAYWLTENDYNIETLSDTDLTINEETLNAMTTERISIAHLLTRSSEGLELLTIDDYRLTRLIHEKTLYEIITEGPDAGKSLIDLLEKTPEGREILANNPVYSAQTGKEASSHSL